MRSSRVAVLAVVPAVTIMLFSASMAFSGTEKTGGKSSFDKVAVIQTTMGNFTVEFFHDDAPAHVDSFIARSLDGFYEGTKFHRVEPGFVIQGGDPNSKDDDPSNDGMGNPGYKLKAEFNDHKHVLGTLSMARSRDPNSAGSQFFICLADVPSLDHKYTVFGQVVSGLDVVKKIGKVDVVAVAGGRMHRPVKPITIEKITIMSRKEWEAEKKSAKKR